MIINAQGLRVHHTISEVILDDNHNYKIFLETHYLPGQHYIELSHAEAVYIQYHLNRLLYK